MTNQTEAEIQASKLSNIVNCSPSEVKKIAEIMANDHPTLQQTFMRLCMYFIYAEAKKDEFRQDGRNSQTVKIAKKLAETVPYEDAYLPYI